MEPMQSIHPLVSGALSYLIQWNSPADNLHFTTRRHLYYALTRTLHQGSEATATYSARPPLPLEIIIQILRDAECTVLSRLSRRVGGSVDREYDVSFGSIAPRIFPSPELAKPGSPLPLVTGNQMSRRDGIGSSCNVYSSNANITWRLWFSVAPFSAHDLTTIHSMQLFTRSGDQGWASDPKAGSWSWFDVVLIPEKREMSDRKEHSWLSHNNGPPASAMQRRAGAEFGPNHDIWQFAQIGDKIGVRACAQFSGWKNIAIMAILIIQEYFIPSFVPQ